LIHSVARNPSLAKQLFGYAILGFALTEAIALFALMMGFFFYLILILNTKICSLITKQSRVSFFFFLGERLYKS